EKLQLGSRDLLLLDRDNLPDAMRRVDDELVRLEALSLSGLLAGHSRNCSFRVRLAANAGYGSPTADSTAHSLRRPPPSAAFLGPPSHSGGLCCVDVDPSYLLQT